MPYTIRPLRKTNKHGALYTHTPATLDALQELLGLAEPELGQRSKIYHREQAGYISNGCLVYLVRTTQGSERIRSALFEAVITRVTRLVRSKTRDLPAQYAEDVVEMVVSRFIEMLVGERSGYNEDLDSLECSFRKTVIGDTIDAFRSLRRREMRRSSIEPTDPDTPLSDEIQKAIDEVGDQEFLKAQDKARVWEGISLLPSFHAAILKLEVMGYPVHSKNGDFCITKSLNKSEKTIHTHLLLARAELRQVLQDD